MVQGLRAASSGLVLALMLCAAPVRAQTPPPAPPPNGHRLFGSDSDPPPPSVPPPAPPHIVMRLDYTGPPGCADPERFALATGENVRDWYPFAPNAPNRLVVVVKRGAQGFEATAELHDPTDHVAWTIPVPAT